MAQGSQAVDQTAKRAALENNDLVEVAALVPQTNFPETPSYTEGETLKAKSGGFQRRDSFFCLGTSNGSWLTLYLPPLI